MGDGVWNAVVPGIIFVAMALAWLVICVRWALRVRTTPDRTRRHSSRTTAPSGRPSPSCAWSSPSPQDSWVAIKWLPCGSRRPWQWG